MEFIASQDVFDLFPGMKLAIAVAYGIDNRAPQPEICTAWRDAWASAAETVVPYPNPQSHPAIVPWRDGFKAMGISIKEFRSSAEALLRRAAKGGEPFSINPLVDFYNTISLRHVAPAGAFDLSAMHGPLELRLTRAGDMFTPLESADDHALVLPAGETAYVTGSTVLTRHFVWRQSREALISPESRDVFLVSEVLSELGEATAVSVCAEFRGGLERWFGVESQTWVADAQNPAIVSSP